MTLTTRGSRSSCITIAWSWQWRRARPITAWYGVVMGRASPEAWHTRTTLASKETWQTPPDTPRCACCPAGIAAGQMVALTEHHFQLRIRQPVEFPLYTSSRRTADTPGTLVPLDPHLLQPLPPIRTVLTSGRRKSQAEVIPVTLHAQLSDIGTLELWCREATGDRQWQLQFDVRATAGTRVAETPRVAGGVTGEDRLDDVDRGDL